LRAESDRSRLAAGVTGGVLLAQLVVLRLVSTANEQFVTLAGRELHWGCAFRDAFGVPCPNCGMTRSVVFSLHGDLARAFEMNPAGPLLVAGGLVLGALLVASAFRRPRVAARAPAANFMRRVVVGTAAYGGLVFVVLMANWLRLIT
jgi:hypothetical protein